MPIILRLPQLKKENPTIDWTKGEITLGQRKQKIHGETPYSLRIARSVMNPAMEFAQKANTRGPLEISTHKTLKQMIPQEYHDFLSVFDKKAAERFPPSRPYDHTIKLKPGFVPKDCKVYPLSQKEQVKLDEFLDENLKKGYIQPFESPMALPFFFVGKKYGSLQPC